MCPPDIFPANPPASPRTSSAVASDSVFLKDAFTANPPVFPVTLECSTVDTTTFKASNTSLIPIAVPRTLNPFPTDAAEPISI